MQRARLGDDDVGEHRERAVTPPYVGLVSTDDVRQAASARRSAAARGLRHLHEREHALLHARAARGGHEHDRRAARRVASSNARAIFSPTTEPIDAPMKRKSIAPSTTGVPPIVRAAGDDRLGAARSSRAPCRATSVYGLAATNSSGSHERRGRRRSRRSVPSSASISMRSGAVSVEVVAAVAADPQVRRRARPRRAMCLHASHLTQTPSGTSARRAVRRLGAAVV